MKHRTRPEITEERIEQIRNIIAENPDWNRTRISQHICRLWGWQSPNGHLKDISCRDMLRALDKAGKIRLPAPKAPSRSYGSKDLIRHFEHDTSPISTPLFELRPLHISRVDSGKELALFKSYIDQYHYLKHLEHNYHSDPEATKIVLESGAPIIMVGLDVTLRTRLTRPSIDEFGSIDSPLAAALFRQMNIYSNHCKRDWLYMHDPLAVGVCLDPTIVRQETASVNVLLAPDYVAGHVVADFNADKGIDICTNVDSERFLEMFVNRVKES
jgi:hypothetical protein